MKKIVVIPDSFKGTLSSTEICDITEERFLKHFPDIRVVKIPVADGGEGSVDSFLAALPGKKIHAAVKGPYMEDVECYFGVIDNGQTAIIEMASCAGLPLVGNNLHAEKTTTYGVGQLIEKAAKSGVKKIILCLGGSATNDLGVGAAAALGVKFFDEDGKSFVPVGETLSKIKKIDKSHLIPELSGIKITAMCDIDNPLYGPTGASYVFAPQKGADDSMVKFLDNELMEAAQTIKKEINIDIADLPGAGAAGGMGGGMVAFLGAELKMGIETILDIISFDDVISDADLVISGEGKIDTQSLRGKVVIGVARRAKKQRIPLIAIVGDIGDNIEKAYEEGVSAIFSINRVAVDFSVAKKRSRQDLELTVDNLAGFLKVFV